MADTGEDGDLQELYSALNRTMSPPCSTDVPVDNDAVRRAILKKPDDAQRLHTVPYESFPLYPLRQAVRRGASLDVVELIYDAHPEAIRHKDHCGWNVLHSICFLHEPSENIVRFLVHKYPAGLKEKDDDDDTPFHLACINYSIPSLDVIRLLVEQYPSAVHMKDDRGKTPLCILRGRRKDSLLRWLEAVSEPLRTVTDSCSSNEEMIAVAGKFSDVNWNGGVALVLDARPTLAHSPGLPLCAMPKLLSFMGRRRKLSTLYAAVRGEPDLLRCARAVRRSKRKRRAIW